MQTNSNTDPISIGGIFVGNTLAFSDAVLNLANAELQGAHFMRAASLSDLLAMETGCDSVQIIVVGEMMWADLALLIPRLHETFGHATIALAYRKPAMAHLLIEALREENPGSRVGFLPMNVHVDCWLSVMRLLANGECFMPSELLSQGPGLAPAPPQADCTPAPEPEPPSPLTDREMQVLRSVAEGKPNKIIADELNLSHHTIKLHIHHVISKLGVNNRTEAAVWYLARPSSQQGAPS